MWNPYYAWTEAARIGEHETFRGYNWSPHPHQELNGNRAK